MDKLKMYQQLFKAAKFNDKRTPSEYIIQARLLYDQASTAGGWDILRNEIITFLKTKENA